MTTPPANPMDGFDNLVHSPNKLRVCALLDTVGEAEFAVMQEQLGLSASVLSKHAGALLEAGYIEQRKAVRDTRQRVWLRLTPRGREAYRGHLAALRAIVGQQTPPPQVSGERGGEQSSGV
ncbi:transcriptional regulator [Streptomyces sp. HD]|uniref:transcriptional regulator n=1 Tax=Streptomyces sp. HD TaxID=3020892 RepID=UPI00232B07C2|nr:transcriptional regulator [Streptomyces sp. HD]MDC0769546.1 transcriptional regulator [Streptomyces sp. HD]